MTIKTVALTAEDAQKRLGLNDKHTSALRQREPFKSTWLLGYYTDGGTYVLASPGDTTDSGQPRDLIAILPGDLGQGAVLLLYVALNTFSVAAIRTLVGDS